MELISTCFCISYAGQHDNQAMISELLNPPFKEKGCFLWLAVCERFCEIFGVRGMIEFLEEESEILVMSAPWLDFKVLFRLQF